MGSHRNLPFIYTNPATEIVNISSTGALANSTGILCDATGKSCKTNTAAYVIKKMKVTSKTKLSTVSVGGGGYAVSLMGR